MLKVRIIPVLLFKNWGIVKSVKFGELRVVGDPTTNAKVFNERNADELMFLDIMATREGREPNFAVIKDIAKVCFMPLTIGGGIKTMEHVDRLFEIGADKVSLNTALLDNPTLITGIAKKYGNQAIVASIDAKREDGKFMAYVGAGERASGKGAAEMAKLAEELGAGEVLLNSIDRDGTAEGYDLELIREVSESTTLPVIACGGCGKLQDFVDAVKNGAHAVSAATLFYYVGESIITSKKYMHEHGVPVRLL